MIKPRLSIVHVSHQKAVRVSDTRIVFLDSLYPTLFVESTEFISAKTDIFSVVEFGVNKVHVEMYVMDVQTTVIPFTLPPIN